MERKKKVKKEEKNFPFRELAMPKSGSTHNDESDNDFSSANENSNLSEINPLVLSSQANLLRQATAAVAFSQNSSSSTSSLLGNDRIGSGLLNSCNNNNINININQNSNQSNSNAGVNSNCSNKLYYYYHHHHIPIYSSSSSYIRPSFLIRLLRC